MTDTLGLKGLQERSGYSLSGTEPLAAHLRPALEGIDRERLARLKAFEFRVALAGLAAGLASILALLAYFGVLGHGLGRLHFAAYLFAPVLTVFALYHWVDEPRRTYVSEYKSRVMPEIARTLFDFDYFEHGWIDPDRITGSMLIPVHENFHTEDLFCGSYAGVDVELCEARLTRMQSGHARGSSIVFNGLFVLMSTQRTFAGRTVLRAESGAVANLIAGSIGGLERVVLEDPEFEDVFEVYASDQLEARSLLTPAFMDRLKTLANDLGEGRLQAAFYDQQFFVMVSMTENLFEPPSIYSSVLQETGLSRVVRQLGDVLSIIDMLKLDERTGSRPGPRRTS